MLLHQDLAVQIEVILMILTDIKQEMFSLVIMAYYAGFDSKVPNCCVYLDDFRHIFPNFP